MKPSRALQANLALALGSLALASVGLELGLRAFGVGAGEHLGTRRIVDARWTRLLDCYPSNPRGYFDIDLREAREHARYQAIAPRRFDGIARLHPWAVLCEYNHLRFRDLPPQPRRAGVRRVVVLGDSFTEGQGVKEQDTLPRVLERLLNAAAPGRSEVRNCGRRALDFPGLYQEFEESLQYEPDLVVYALVLNDAVRTPDFQARQSYVNDWILEQERTGEDERAEPRFEPRLLELVQERVAAWRVGRESTRWYREMWSDANPGWPETQRLIRRMRDELASRDAKLLVAVWPLLVSVESSYPFEDAHRAIAGFCASAGIRHHELLPALRGQPTSALWVHAVDHHPNELAQRLAAESLAPVVREVLGAEPMAGAQNARDRALVSDAP